MRVLQLCLEDRLLLGIPHASWHEPPESWSNRSDQIPSQLRHVPGLWNLSLDLEGLSQAAAHEPWELGEFQADERISILLSEKNTWNPWPHKQSHDSGGSTLPRNKSIGETLLNSSQQLRASWLLQAGQTSFALHLWLRDKCISHGGTGGREKDASLLDTWCLLLVV